MRNPDVEKAMYALATLGDESAAHVDWTLAYECDRCKMMKRIHDNEDAKLVVGRGGLCGECSR